MKKILCIILIFLVCCSNIVFASDYAYIDSYKTELACDTFSDEIPLSSYALYNCELTKSTINGENAVCVDITKTGHFIRRNFSLVTKGTLVCEFDILVPDASVWTKSFQVGITNSTGVNTPLFGLLPSGYIRSTIDANYANLQKFDLTGWCTFRIEFDLSGKTFNVYAGEKGTELLRINGLANNFYAGKENFAGGVKGFYIVSSAQTELDNAYYLDNIKANVYPKAFEAVNTAKSIAEAESILDAYSKAGLIELPSVYLDINDKSDILHKLINSELTCDEDIISVISDGFGVFEEKIYADLSDMFTSDIIGSIGQKPSGTFGIGRSLGWFGDGNGNLRDNYLGQGYNADSIKEKLDEDNILKVSNTENSSDYKTIAFNESTLNAGVNDAYILTTSASKGADGLYVSANDMTLELFGKNLSSIDIATIRGSFNYAFLLADIYYEDGTVSHYEDVTNRIPMLGERIKGYYMTDDLGRCVYADESGALSYDTRALSTVTNSFDNRSKSYMSVRTIGLDISKKASKICLYTKTKWGQGSLGIMAVTYNPATNNELIEKVKSIGEITAATINPETDFDILKSAYGCANELTRRGIYSVTDSDYRNVEALLNMCCSYEENYLVMTNTFMYDENGEVTTSVKDAKRASVYLTYNNKYQVPVKTTAFAAFYDSELKMLDISDFEIKDINPGVSSDSFENLDVPFGTETIYVYVWDDFNGISPYVAMAITGGAK